MRMWTTKDAHCPSCHGTGNLSEGRMIDGEWWESFFTCYCVEYHRDEEMKEFLAKFNKGREVAQSKDIEGSACSALSDSLGAGVKAPAQE